ALLRSEPRRSQLQVLSLWWRSYVLLERDHRSKEDATSSLRGRSTALFAEERDSERRGRTDSATGGLTGCKHQDEDCEEIGQHAEEERRYVHARALEAKLTRLDSAKEVRTECGPSRVPSGEDHQRDRDPAAPGCNSFGPPGVGGERNRRAAKSSERTTCQHVEITQAPNVEPHGVGRFRTLSDCAKVQTLPGSVDIKPEDRHQEV